MLNSSMLAGARPDLANEFLRNKRRRFRPSLGGLFRRRMALRQYAPQLLAPSEWPEVTT